MVEAHIVGCLQLQILLVSICHNGHNILAQFILSAVAQIYGIE